MSIEGLIGTGILSGLVLLITVYPLFKRQGRTTISIDRQRERAMLYYERILLNVRDLDEDHQTAKIGKAEYVQEREFWMARGVQVLQLLDQLDQEHSIIGEVVPSAMADINIDATIDARINAFIESSIHDYRNPTATSAPEKTPSV